MRKRVPLLLDSRGYTLLEMIVAVTIIAILVSLIEVSYDTVRARVRYSQVKAEMDTVAQSAYNDYTSHDNTWAAYVGPGAAPSFINPTELQRWPIPPCPGWTYSWDNWTAFPQNLARLTVYATTGGTDRPIYSYCVQSAETSCFAPDINGYVPLNISALTSPYIYCNE